MARPDRLKATSIAVTRDGHVRTLREIEAEFIQVALTRSRGCVAETARTLGIGRTTLYRKLDIMGLHTTAGAPK